MKSKGGFALFDRLILKAALLTGLIVFIGCAKPSSNLKPETLARPDFKIGAESAADYYRHFYIDVVGECEISAQPLYDRFLLGQLSSLSGSSLKVLLYLKPDHTYSGRIVGSKNIEGLWTVIDDEIHLDGFGYGQAFQFNGEKVIRFSVRTGQTSGGISGGRIEFDLVLSLVERTHDAESPLFKPYAERFAAGCAVR